MMVLLAFVAVILLNGVYLFSFRNLMTKLEKFAPAYWESIGRPNSFSANHVFSIISRLYGKGMSDAAQNASIVALLRRVQILLPVTFVVTGVGFFALSRVINSA